MIKAAKSVLKHILPAKLVKLISTFKYPLIYSYNQDGLATQHNCDFMKDKLFMESYKRGKNTGSWESADHLRVYDIHWRAYIACWAANKTKNLEGDFVECGVNKGGLAMTVMHYTNFKTLGKKFYLLDTFCGLPERCISEEEQKIGIGKVYNNYYEECYDIVKETFKEFTNVEIIKGTMPDTLPLVKSQKVCYLSIDMNCAAPEIAAGEFFWDKLVTGAVIVLVDYFEHSFLNLYYQLTPLSFFVLWHLLRIE